MSSAPMTRARLRRRRLARRRLVAAVLAAIIVTALTVAVFGFVRSLGERPRTPAAAAKIAAVSASSPSSAATETSVAAPEVPVDTTAAADAAMAVLAEYSDAARTTEDALYSAIEALRAAASSDAAVAAQAHVDQAADAVKADALAYRAELASRSAGSLTQPTGGDVAAQMSYLHRYVTAYNSAEWGDYNRYGGDCTNFASQGLIARGWHTDGTWYSKGAMWTVSKPWIATAPMAAYFDGLGLSYSTEADLDRVRVGDIGLFNWGETGAGMDHTMTVSKVEYVPGGPPTVYFIGHNSDAEYRELNTALYVEHENSTVRIYHIP